MVGGMKVSSHEGSVLEVVKLEPLSRSPVTYNIEVADFHTYFVGKQGAWVYNMCDCTVSKKVNGNSKQSTNKQHLYMIQDEKGNIKKVGVSGQPLNKNGTSPRANRQLKQGDKPTVLEKEIDGKGSQTARQVVLQKEGQVVEGLKKAGEKLPDQKRPKI